MSLHYPHLAARVVAGSRLKDGSVQLARGVPPTGQEKTTATANLSAGRMRVHARLGSTGGQAVQVRGYWRESAPVVGGFLVFLITAWLIWAALATAASALIETV